jgi:hypothetical protein
MRPLASIALLVTVISGLTALPGDYARAQAPWPAQRLEAGRPNAPAYMAEPRLSPRRGNEAPAMPISPYGGLQLDVTALLEQPPPPEPAARQHTPMFSNGWTRDGFGGQPRGWR